MLKALAICFFIALLAIAPCRAQETTGAAKPTEHLIGTVTKVDQAAHTVTVKEDKTGTESLVLLENTRTLLKVPPGAKDLKSAVRITAEDLRVGDRVDVRGSKPEDNPNAIVARSVVLMSGRDLAQAHQAEAAAWQHSTAGIVTSVDTAAGTLSITLRTPEGPKPATVKTSSSTDFTRYSAESPKTPVRSQLADIQPDDQVRVIGDKSEDGATITAQKIYSGAFRTIAGTVTTVAPDGKRLTVKDLQTKQPVEVNLTDNAIVRKLPPTMAMMLARRFNPDYKAAQTNAGAGNAGNSGGAPPYGAKAGEAAGGENASNRGTSAGSGPGAGSMRGGTGDLSRILERAPAISVSDLKPGDAVVISGADTGADKTHLIASSIIAGVEPIFQSAPPRQGRSLGDWSLDMEAPAQ
jgi:hypothetical protein